MSSIWTKSAVFAASAALLSLAALPALAQPEEMQPPPEEVQPQEMPTGVERQSKPKVAKDTAQEMRLRQARPPRKCRSGADTEDEAEEDCAPQLQCQPPAVVKCQYRPNNQDWICSCK